MADEHRHDFEKPLESAYHHTVEEFGIENIKPSFRIDFESLQKAHNAIHEYMLLAPLLIPSKIDTTGWHRKSAFLTYHWEVFHHAHRSLIEALCGYYNVAFILLRTTFELLIKGAFWECLSHKTFRDNSQVLDNDKQGKGKAIKGWLNSIFEVAPNVEEEFEQISASIYDKIETKVEETKFRISTKTIVRQLDQWGILQPITKTETQIYNGIYGRLSADVHAIPDRTDIGKRLITESAGLFEQELLPERLREYANSLHELMDLAIVIELNILAGEHIKKYDEVKKNLRGRLNTLEQLKLEYSLKRVMQLLE